MSRSSGITETQANVFLLELGVITTATVLFVAGALRSFLKVKQTAEDVSEQLG